MTVSTLLQHETLGKPDHFGTYAPAAFAVSGLPSGRFVGVVAAVAPTGGPYFAGDYAIDDTTPSVWVCTVAGSPGTWLEISGGGGAAGVASFNTRTGVVTLAKADVTGTGLAAADVGAQPHDTDLDAIAALDSATAGALATDGAGWIRKTYPQLKTALGLIKGDVGLGNVDNTSDVNKPVSTAQQTALNAKADLVGGVVPTAQIPSIAITDVFTVATQAAMLALTAQRGDMALRTDTGHRFVLSSDSPGTLADWVDLGVATDDVASVNGQTGVVVLGKADVGLANVDNTSDVNKPVSTAQQTALDLKSPLASPTFTGTPAAPTAVQGTNTTQVATTAYVQTEVGLLVPKSLVDAKGDLLVGSADNTLIRLGVGADGQVLQADSTQSSGVKWNSRSRSVADVHADASVVNSIVETTLASLGVPITVVAGDILRFVFVGDLLNSSGAGVNCTWKFKLGATAILLTTAVNIPTTAARRTWRADGSILVVAPASDQRANAFLFVNNTTSGAFNVQGLNTNNFGGAGRGTAAEDLTAGKTLDFTMTLGTASASADCFVHEATLEVIKR